MIFSRQSVALVFGALHASALRIVGFPPRLVQVEAKFGNQIGPPFPSRRFPHWLAQVEANLAAGHVAEPNEATTEASLGTMNKNGTIQK